MSTDITLAKETHAMTLFAKLLAEEDIDVIVENISEAAWDLKNRQLILPNMKDGIPNATMRLFVGHEVGHAKFTNFKDYEDAGKKYGDNLTNIVEDVRIENLMQASYPGLKKYFKQGYRELFGNEYFTSKPMKERNFLDRFNLHMKCGAFLNVPFSDEEMGFVTAAKSITKWEEALSIIQTLRAYIKEQEKKNPPPKNMDGNPNLPPKPSQNSQKSDSQPEEDDSSSTTDGDRTDKCESQDFLNKKFKSLLPDKEDVANIFVPRIFKERHIVPLDVIINDPQANKLADPYVLHDYNRLTKADINYMTQLFIIRKNARARQLTRQQRVGELDIHSVHEYQFSDDIFVSRKITPREKNHGMMLFMDWSGSMQKTLYHSVVQLLCLTDFCKQMRIPFEVYSFTNGIEEELKELITKPKKSRQRNNDIKIVDHFGLRHLLSSKMSAASYLRMKTILLSIARRISEGPYIQKKYFDTGGTPLHETAMVAVDLVEEFRAVNKLDIVNIIFVTDGESAITTDAFGLPHLVHQYQHIHLHHRKYQFVTKIKPHDGRRNCQTASFLEMLSVCAKTNVIGFFLCEDETDTRITDKASYNSNGFFSTTEEGYTDFHIIKSELTITPDKGVIFNKNAKNKRMLERFIELIA